MTEAKDQGSIYCCISRIHYYNIGRTKTWLRRGQLIQCTANERPWSGLDFSITFVATSLYVFRLMPLQLKSYFFTCNSTHARTVLLQSLNIRINFRGAVSVSSWTLKCCTEFYLDVELTNSALVNLPFAAQRAFDSWCVQLAHLFPALVGYFWQFQIVKITEALNKWQGTKWAKSWGHPASVSSPAFQPSLSLNWSSPKTYPNGNASRRLAGGQANTSRKIVL